MDDIHHDGCVTCRDTVVNTRLDALRHKHAKLSERVEHAQKDKSTTDYYLNQLKKQKLLLKEKLTSEMERTVRKETAS